MKDLEKITSTVLYKKMKQKDENETAIFECFCVAAMGLDPPHTSFLLVLNIIRKLSPEKSHRRDTDIATVG